MTSLRKSLNAHCRWCVYDDHDRGSAAQQIAACQMTKCNLFPVRPITCKSLPLRLLDHWGVSPDSLDDRARALISQERVDSDVYEEEIAPPIAEAVE